jgi:ABC-type nitrate/sulfonate/bicarbonate transport system substrate-binding protein
MTANLNGMNRRQYLAAGASVLVLGLGSSREAAAQAATFRQGYQTNMWGMPTYYLMKSGLLEKRGIKTEEFPVPSGNLTMQQMVARQVDLGTYVGRTTRVMARKDLNITKVEQLKGLKVANQSGSSIGNIFMDQLAPRNGLKKGEFQEVRMDVNNMIAAMAAKTVDAMVNTEPYNTIAEAEGIATTIMDYSSVDSMPVFMAATPDFVEKNGNAIVSYLQAWREVAAEFKSSPDKVSDTIYSFYTSKGYSMTKDVFRKALGTIDVNPGWPSGLEAYMQKEAEVLLREKKISAIPDWKKALRPDFWAKATA